MRTFDLFQRGSPEAVERQDRLIRALESLLIEKTRLFILETVYLEDKRPLKLSFASLPDIFLLNSGLCLEQDMPRLSATYQELEASRNIKLRRPSYLNLNELLKPHQIQFISKQGEIEQRFKEIEAQLVNESPEFAEKLIKKWEAHSSSNPKSVEILVKPLHEELLVLAHDIKVRLMGPNGFLDDLVNFLPGDEEKLEAKASYFKSLAQFFHRYLVKLQGVLNSTLFNENQKIYYRYSDLFYQASYIVELIKYRADLDNYYQAYLAVLNGKISEFQKTTPETLAQISITTARNEFRREIAKLEILDELLKKRNFQKNKIDLLSTISEKFWVAVKLLISQDHASNDLRRLNRKRLNQEVGFTFSEINDLNIDIKALLHIRSKLEKLHLRAQKLFGENLFCLEIFLELFMVCNNLEKRLLDIKNKARQGWIEKFQTEFSLIQSFNELTLENLHGVFDAYHLSHEMLSIYSESSDLQKIRETAKSWLRGKMNPGFIYHLNKQIGESLRSLKPLSSLIEDFLMGNTLTNISDILHILNRRINLLIKIPRTSHEIFGDRTRWIIRAQTNDSVIQLKKAGFYYFSLSQLDPLPLGSRTGELLQWIKNLHQELKAREVAVDSLEGQYTEIWHDDTPLDKPWANQILHGIEAEQKKLGDNILELQKGLNILESLDGFSDAHKAFFSEKYFPKLKNEFQEFSNTLQQYFEQMSVYIKFEEVEELEGEFETLDLSIRELEPSSEEKLDELPRKKSHESDASEIDHEEILVRAYTF